MIQAAIMLFLPAAQCPAAENQSPPKLQDQSFYVHSWPVDDGTYFNTVIAAVRRPDGYMWAVTYAGLFRFDGQEFLAVKQISGEAFKGSLTPICLQDRNGRFWVTSDRGAVACIDGADIRLIAQKDGVPAQSPVSIAGDKDGAVWISYPGDSLFRIKGAEMRAVRISGNAENTHPIRLASDSNGQIWMAHGRQIGVIRDGQVKTLLQHEQPVSLITKSGGGGVLISDGRQIWIYREGGLPEPVDQVPPGNITAMYEDRRGSLWATVINENGCVLFCREGEAPRNSAIASASVSPFGETTAKDHLASPESLNEGGSSPFNRLRSSSYAGQEERGSLAKASGVFLPVQAFGFDIFGMSDDQEGNLWVSTRRAGLIQVRKKSIEILSPKPDVTIGIRSLCESKEGVRFATGANRMLFCLRGSSWEQMTPQQGWAGDIADCVAADPRGGIWISTRTNGLYRWQGEFSHVDNIDLSHKQKYAAVSMLFVDSKGALWFDYDGNLNLCRYYNDVLTNLAHPKGGMITSMAEDRDGNLWAGTTYGQLLRVDGDKLVDQTPGSPEIHGSIRCLYAAKNGCLWIGYRNHGLGRLNKKKFVQFDSRQGLPDKTISQILEDDVGWLWCAGNNGIFRLKIEELDSVAENRSQEIHPVMCVPGDGSQVSPASGEYWPRAMRSSSGELWMSVGSGIAVICPERNIANAMPPPSVVISSLKVNGKLVAAYDSHLEHAATNAWPVIELRNIKKRKLSIGPGVHQLVVEFGVISFTDTKTLRYQYRLEGCDDSWVDSGSRPSAYYNMIPPGVYKFRVRACNNEGVWNNTGARQALLIEPFYWQTLWFKGVCFSGLIIATGVIVFLVVRRRTMRRLETLERQQALEKERSRIARDMHDDLGSNLTRIVMLSEPDQTGTGASPASDAALGEINETARDMTLKMSGIVWALNPEYDSLESFADYVGKISHDVLGKAGIPYRLDLPIDLPARSLSSPLRHNLLLAFKEALHNIIKHAGAARVLVSLKLEKESFILHIEDNGKGFDAPRQDLRQGNGLANMKHRLAEIGARFELESQPGHGVCIRFIVPLSHGSGGR